MQKKTNMVLDTNLVNIVNKIKICTGLSKFVIINLALARGLQELFGFNNATEFNNTELQNIYNNLKSE